MKLKLSPDVAALNPDLKESGLATARLAGSDQIKGLHTDLADVFQTITMPTPTIPDMVLVWATMRPEIDFRSVIPTGTKA